MIPPMRKIKEVATFKNLDHFLDYVRLFFKEKSLNVDLLQDITLVIEELLVNIILYSYPKGNIGEVELSLLLLDNNLKINITDNGIPFNPLKHLTPDISLPLKQRGIGNLGIHLVKSLVDKIKYERKTEKNFLTLFKTVNSYEK
jgi:anti-sigma regulatory factor (Ser/Thr protein kinase)